ncbi:MAG: type II CAAX endopeptidase family protein [Nitrospira sp.]|nr:CPBP family intramembrane metalloprotease [Nitrospira sp.]
MNEQMLAIGQLPGLPEDADSTVSQASPLPYSSRWSRFVSVLCAGILLASLAGILWLSLTVPKLQRFEEPDRALDLMVSRMMQAQDGLRRAPIWQQWVAEWTMDSQEEASRQAVRWYRELIATTDDPSAKLRLAILLGESEHNAEALTEAQSWHDRGTSAESFRQLIEAAYGMAPLSQARARDLQAMLAETLPIGWFYDHLAARIAQRTGDHALLTTVEAQSQMKEEQVQRWIRPLMIGELACLALGAMMLLGIMRLKGRRLNILQLHSPGVPPPWSGGTAAAVILRGGALGALMTIVFLSIPALNQGSLRVLAIPLANLPLLAIAYVHLLKPAGLDFRQGFGLRINRKDLGRLVCVIFAVVSAALWGEWVMGQAAEFLKLENHWTEWFDQELVWATPSMLAISLVEYVVLAPIFEELAFRGLLFAMLRRRFTFLPAALLSATIFALAHGYSLLGFISVLWSGFLWAWIYDRTGSLIPGMVAHAINNLLVCLTVMALLR